MFVKWTRYCNSYYSSDNHGFLKITNFKPLKKDILCKLVMQNSTPLYSYHEMFQGHVCKVLLYFLCQPVSLNLTWLFFNDNAFILTSAHAFSKYMLGECITPCMNHYLALTGNLQWSWKELHSQVSQTQYRILNHSKSTHWHSIRKLSSCTIQPVHVHNFRFNHFFQVNRQKKCL